MPGMGFSELVAAIRRGSFSAELDEALTDAAYAAVNTLKPATITVTITLTPKGNGKMDIKEKVSARKPAEEHLPSLFFVNEGTGDLSRESPHQMSLRDLAEDKES